MAGRPLEGKGSHLVSCTSEPRGKWATSHHHSHAQPTSKQRLFQINSWTPNIWHSHSANVIYYIPRTSRWTKLTNLVTDSRMDLTLDSPSWPKYTTVRWILLSWRIHTSLREWKNQVHSRKCEALLIQKAITWSFNKRMNEALLILKKIIWSFKKILKWQYCWVLKGITENK